MTTAYTVDLADDQYLSDVSGQVASSAALVNKTSDAGAAGADPAVFTAVAGSVGTYMITYQDTGTAATSRLICYHDTITGLPVTPNGGDIRVSFNSGIVFTL